MAKAKDATGGLPEVEVPASGDALAAANEAAKVVSDDVTDVTEAKEVVEVNGTKIVRW